MLEFQVKHHLLLPIFLSEAYQRLSIALVDRLEVLQMQRLLMDQIRIGFDF